MHLTPDELAAIAGKSASLEDRLDGSYMPIPGTDPKVNMKVEARLKEWASVVAEGDQELFEKRLAYDGLSPDTIRPLLGDVRLAQKVPAWTEVINPILSCARTLELERIDDFFHCLKKEDPVPFEEILLPFVLTGREMLKNASRERNLLTANARAALERFLLIRMSELSSRVLELEFNTFFACLQFAGISYDIESRDKASRKHYLTFVKEMCEENLALLFKEYPVLARRLATRLNQWVQVVEEFVARLQADLTEIRMKFFEGKNIGKVADLELGLSDSHRQGRTVMIITFESGAKLVYKPKEMSIEEDYFQFAAWLNSRGPPLDFKVLKVLNRGTYGWVEFVEANSMEYEGQARRFYQRSGMLLCLVYVCDGLDFHNENVLACGEYPVPIDLETIFHHRVIFTEEVQELTDAAKEKINDSVLRTHFLPSFFQIKDKYVDISGFGGVAQEIVVEFLRWRNINTDAMEYSQERTNTANELNVPRIGEKPLLPEDYIEHLAEGFRRMYRFLTSQKALLLSNTGPLITMLQNKARFIFRPTSLYISIERRVTHPDYQKEGVDLSIQIDVLTRSLVPGEERPVLWKLVREEAESMWEMDVPKFMTPGDSDSIALSSGEILSQCFSQAPLERVKRNIMEMCEADMAWQAKLIEASLKYRETSNTITSNSSPANQSFITDVPLLTKSELLEHALFVASVIEQHAIVSKRNEPSWVVLKVIPNSKQRMLQSMDSHLYDGVCGVTLFLGALDRLVPGSGFRDMARNSLGPMIRWLNKRSPKKLIETSIGGCTGLPSLAYSLTHLSDFLADPALLKSAERAALLVEQKDIDADKSFDVISGAAGTALALLPLYRKTGNKEILQTAIYCGDHLLRNRTETHKEFRVWKTLHNSPPLAGFAHGAAGISFALTSLYRETRRVEFLDAAIEAINFEADLFDSDARNWPDRRVDDDSPGNAAVGFMCGWCQGAAGIGVARVGGLDVIDTPSIHNDIQVALQTTLEFPFQPRDHICCGNVGRSESLLTAGIALSERKWIDGSEQLTATVIAKAKSNQKFGALFGQEFFNPSMYQGYAGIGYHLLRLAEPRLLPSLILFE